jgi:hypothetical protein
VDTNGIQNIPKSPGLPTFMTQYPDLFAGLAAPFEAHEVKQRAAAGGRQLHYITARTAMNRLDSVLGPEAWWDEYEPIENGVICRLTIRLPDGSALTKCDAGGYAGMETKNKAGEMVPDEENDGKSGFSDAFKRAAAKFGIARYLYRDGVPNFVREREPAQDVSQAVPSATADSTARPPARQEQATAPASAPLQRQAPSPNGQGAANGGSVPRSGKGLFAWVKEMEQKHEVGLLKYLNGWAKLQEFPGRMVDWDADQVAAGHAEACRKLKEVQPAGQGGGEDGPAYSQAPSAQASDGGAIYLNHPDADGREKLLKGLRGQLLALVHQIAKLQKPGLFVPKAEDIALALKSLSRRDPKGREIETISPCDDPNLLLDFIEVAEFLLADLKSTETDRDKGLIESTKITL